MDELGEKLKQMFSRSFTKINPDTSAPVLEQDDILKVNDEINSFINRAGNIGTNALTRCSQQADMNVVYQLIKPVIHNTSESICECFGRMISQVLEGSELYAAGVRAAAESVRVGSKMLTPGNIWPSSERFI